MRMLVVTEKCSPEPSQRDGGARLVESLRMSLGSSLCIMQFGQEGGAHATWRFDYPFWVADRFERRLANAPFVAEKVKEVEKEFTHVLFIHISMQFGLTALPLKQEMEIWTFPMFLTPSYRLSGENVPQSYTDQERQTLMACKNILTPSYFEKRQLEDFYSVCSEHIHVIPRGIVSSALIAKTRSLSGPPKFCSVGSIKPQKNTLGLVSLFSEIRTRYPDATLSLIGPVQNREYDAEVRRSIEDHKLKEAVHFSGYIEPGQLSLAIIDSHIHLSASRCETFGRAIFETLACGLPNIARAAGNAAVQFLDQLPYVRFLDDSAAILEAIDEMLHNLPLLSSMACEIGTLYDDRFLSALLCAKICERDAIAVSDFDGTLFHKSDPEKTQQCMEAFMRYPIRVICSARSIGDLLKQLNQFDLKVDWLIGFSGAVVANGAGNILWQTPLTERDLASLQAPQFQPIFSADRVVQVACPVRECAKAQLPGIRKEVYQDTAYFSNWHASKLRAVQKLLCFINWQGRVQVFGDGPYDRELVRYFDGVLNQQKEKIHV